MAPLPSVALLMALAFLCFFTSSESTRALTNGDQGIEPNKNCTGRWCIMNPEQDPALILKDLNYFCTVLSCFEIKPGGRCFEPNTTDFHASVVFNLFYKSKMCEDWACTEDGSGLITFQDPSTPTCIFH